jgi:hypothetical protein
MDWHAQKFRQPIAAMDSPMTVDGGGPSFEGDRRPPQAVPFQLWTNQAGGQSQPLGSDAVGPHCVRRLNPEPSPPPAQ